MPQAHAHVVNTLFESGQLNVGPAVTLGEADDHLKALLDQAKFGYGGDNLKVVDGDVRTGFVALLIKDGEDVGKDRIAEIVTVPECRCSSRKTRRKNS